MCPSAVYLSVDHSLIASVLLWFQRTSVFGTGDMVFKTLSFGGYNPHSFSAYASLPALEIMLNVIYRTIKDVNEISEHLNPKRFASSSVTSSLSSYRPSLRWQSA